MMLIQHIKRNMEKREEREKPEKKSK